MKTTTTTTISQGIRQGLDKLVGLKERYTIQSTIKNLVGTESVLGSLAGNAKMFILTALAASLLLLGGTQFGTAFAQPVSDPVTIFSSSEFVSWNSTAEENDFLPATPKVVIATGNANGLMAMAEENDFLGGALKVVFATGQVYISEENQSLLNSTKVVFASSQAYVSEENESLTNSPKLAFASRQAYISAENDFGV